MADLDTFRQEVREYLEANAPESIRGAAGAFMMFGGGGDNEDARKYRRAMIDKGWTAPTWPTEYGGGGLSEDQAKVLQQEMGRLRLSPPFFGMGLWMIGPTLLVHGNEEQKREQLPKIVRNERTWCQGFSEPNAGSDLAALQTRAVLDGDDYILNGQKIWTSGGQFADWMFAIVRTDPDAPKQNGISFIVLDMKSPGVEVKPITMISGTSPFCEVFLTDVRVPARNVVGQVNQGWTVAKTLLGFERSGMGMRAQGGGGGGGAARRRRGGPGQAQLVSLAKKYVGEQQGRIAEHGLRDQVARLSLDRMALQLSQQRAADAAKAGMAPGPETSMFKVVSTELGVRSEELAMSLRGASALGWEGEGFASDELQQTRSWLGSKATTIYGGTSEIQMNIIAKRVLQLPD